MGATRIQSGTRKAMVVVALVVATTGSASGSARAQQRPPGQRLA